MMVVYYFAIKTFFLFSLVRSLVKFEPLQKHFVFLGLLYTSGVAFLSYVFLISPLPSPNWRQWEIWVGETLLLSTFYFWLLGKFDEGLFFVLLLAAGVAVVLF